MAFGKGKSCRPSIPDEKGEGRMETYVVYVQTDKEDAMKKWIESNPGFMETGCNLWVPRKPIYHKRKGAYILLHQILFPSYVFIDAPDYEILWGALKMIEGSNNVKLLEDWYRIEEGGFTVNSALNKVTEEERDWIIHLYGENPSKGILENKRIRFVEGSLMGMEEYVIKLDRHSRKCLVRIPFLGREAFVWLAVDFLYGPEQDQTGSLET